LRARSDILGWNSITPIVVYVLKLTRAQPHSREILFPSLLGFAARSFMVGSFYILDPQYYRDIRSRMPGMRGTNHVARTRKRLGLRAVSLLQRPGISEHLTKASYPSVQCYQRNFCRRVTRSSSPS
jgi:hypothetical protein